MRHADFVGLEAFTVSDFDHAGGVREQVGERYVADLKKAEATISTQGRLPKEETEADKKRGYKTKGGICISSGALNLRRNWLLVAMCGHIDGACEATNALPQATARRPLNAPSVDLH